MLLQLSQYIAFIRQQARSNGYSTTIAGRRRPVKPGQSKGAAAEADRKAVNSTIQGSAADLIKLAMCRWVHSPSAQPQPGLVFLYTPPFLLTITSGML